MMLSVLRRAATRCAPKTVLVKVLSNAYASGAHSSGSRVITPTTNEERSLNTKVPTSVHTLSAAGNHGDQANLNIDQNSTLSLIPHHPYSLTTHHSGLPLKFTVNGTIDNPQGLYFVPPNNDRLLAAIHAKAYIMVTGHRGSGKSTRAWYTMHNQLQEYEPLMVSLQGVDTTTEESFWHSLGDYIKGIWNWPPDLPDIVDKRTFINFFRFHRGKRIVLFLDEFDLILRNPAALASLYDVLRSMKEVSLRPKIYGLQAVVAIGPFNILAYTKENLSPFNVADHWSIPYFTLEQVEKLFREFQQLAGITLEDGVVLRIFTITSGHPGLVCFCGKQIDEFLIPGRKHLTLQQWKEYESAKLPGHVTSGWRTVLALSEEVKAPHFSDYLIWHVLSKRSPPKYDQHNPVQLALIGLGALTKLAGDLVSVPSPLIRQIILISLAKASMPKLDSFAVSASGGLDIPSLMRMVKFFQANHMRAAPQSTFKQNKTSGADVKDKDNVPHEDTYAFQLFRVLLAAVPDNWAVFPLMKGPDSLLEDFVVEDSHSNRVVLELLAHEADGIGTDPSTTRGTVVEHLHRSSTKYAKIDNVSEVWVINFTTKQPSSKPKCGYVWPEDAGVDELVDDGVSVKIVHVWHDLAWTTAKITTRNKQGDAYTYNSTTVDLKQ